MSKYEWERGTLKLSVKEYAKTKKVFIDVVKKHQQDNYDKAVKLYNKIIENTKGKRGVDFHSSYHHCQFDRTTSYDMFGSRENSINLDESGTFYEKYLSRTKKPLKPKKKDYLTKVERKDVRFESDDFSITFSDKTKTITWEVYENNHARDHAHEHPVAKALFMILKGVDWTRGTGGTIVGNDEYNQDTDYAGGGGNYITMSFGPIGKESRKSYAMSCY
jgi:hypothetical protein